MEDQRITAIDLFSGAGGFSLGMELAGIEVLAAVEFDEKIAHTYRHNHPQTVMINDDIRNIGATKDDPYYHINGISILDHLETNEKRVDIIFGGPPCQGFSMAGKRIRKNESFLEDDRNKLFLDFFRMVKYIKPKIFIIENVTGILNFDNGNVKKEIHKLFESIGYTLDSQVLSAEKFGVPQMRKRAFFIGNNIGIDSSSLFPKENVSNDFVSVWDAISDLPSLKSGEGIEPTTYCLDSQNSYQKKMRNTNNNMFFNHISSDHTQKTLDILKLVKPGQTMKDLPVSLQTKSVHSGAYGRMKKDEPSYTLTTRINTPSVGRITHPLDDRTITPREAARIQSFPDSYHFLGDITTIGIQIGNSVPPLLGKAIGDEIVSKIRHNIG